MFYRAPGPAPLDPALLAREIERAGRAPKLLIQVNTGEEPQKGGVVPGQLDTLLADRERINQQLQEIIDQADPDAVKAFGHEAKNAGKASPEGEGNWAKSSFEDLVQYNDGFRTQLIGTPEQVAERIVAYKKLGVDLVLGGFLHFQEEIEYFGERVLPLVRELELADRSATV